MANLLKVRNLWSIFLLILMLIPIGKIEAGPPVKLDPQLVERIVDLLDIQIPGWERIENPAGTIRKEDTVVATAYVKFQRGIENITIMIKDHGDNYAGTNLLPEISENYATKIDYKGFPALKVTPPLNPYEELNSSLFINIENRYLVYVDASEVMDFEHLVTAVDLIDFTQLTAQAH
jgi:hypothetical protein